MIKTFAHKGLERFFRTKSTAGIQAKHADKLRLILYKLNTAAVVGDVDFPGAHLHPLKGDMKGLWSVRVNGNWRATFEMEDGDVYVVDYTDYH